MELYNQRDLFFRLANNDKEARDILIEKNLPLVRSLVNRYKYSNYDKDDLFQIGCIGLINAIDKFDLSYNVQFSTYAVPLILGEIKKHFRDEGSIKVSRGLKELHIKIQDFKNEYISKFQNEPRLEDIAKSLNVSIQDIVLALESHYYPTSLNESIYENEDSNILLEDVIPQEEKFSHLDHICLEQGIDNLNEREKELIYLRYYEDFNQTEIAKKMKISQVQVSRLEKRIIEKLRKQFV